MPWGCNLKFNQGTSYDFSSHTTNESKTSSNLSGRQGNSPVRGNVTK